eukprot:4473287-Amphidinium_carterae.1
MPSVPRYYFLTIFTSSRHASHTLTPLAEAGSRILVAEPADFEIQALRQNMELTALKSPAGAMVVARVAFGGVRLPARSELDGRLFCRKRRQCRLTDSIVHGCYVHDLALMPR